MARERIEHEGKVVSVDKDYIAVEILNKSACAACHAKGVCGASDQAVKVVEVAQDITTLTQDFQVGETVNVVMAPSMGTQAVWFAYVIPLMVLRTRVLDDEALLAETPSRVSSNCSCATLTSSRA